MLKYWQGLKDDAEAEKDLLLQLINSKKETITFWDKVFTSEPTSCFALARIEEYNAELMRHYRDLFEVKKRLDYINQQIREVSKERRD